LREKNLHSRKVAEGGEEFRVGSFLGERNGGNLGMRLCTEGSGNKQTNGGKSQSDAVFCGLGACNGKKRNLGQWPGPCFWEKRRVGKKGGGGGGKVFM